MFFSKLYAGTANKIYTYNGTDWEISFNALEDAYYAISFITFNNMIYAGMGNGYIFAGPSFQMPAINTVAVPEFLSFLILPPFIVAALLAIAVYKRKSGPK